MSESESSRGKIIETFAGTGSRALGIIVLVIGVLALGDILVEWRTLEGLRAAMIIIALGALVWISMVRPGVVIRENVVVLRNMIRDVAIPWHLVKDVEIRPILTITTEDDNVYRSSAIAHTAGDRRAALKNKAKLTEMGMGSSGPPPGSPGVGPGGSATAKASNMRLSELVTTRIRSLSEKNAEVSKGTPQVVSSWAALELAVVGVAVIAAVVISLML